ncbi:MAG: glycosyltransferase family 4 protein [Treponema sp.]|nr:glycosyltransferase family 4 protein [Treponema sp.]
MRIGIDTCGCDHGRSGLGAFLLSFVGNIPHTDNEIELFGLEEDRFTYSSDKDFVYKAVPPLKSLKALQRWHKLKAGKFLLKNNYDGVIYPAPEKVIPYKHKVPSVAFVNTIISSKKDSSVKKHLKKGLKNVGHIIASSEFVLRDLVLNGIDESKITVIYNGIDHKVFYPVLDLDSDVLDIKPFAIKRPYFLYCTRLSGPEKKHIELIRAFELFKKKTGSPHRLVIAGQDGDYSEKIQKAAFDSPFAEDIFVTGFFPYHSLAKLYAGSDACVFPAVNEGVGLPILEAMACGVPVICSKSGALPEMGGDVPLYFEANNIDEIADTMGKVISDAGLRKKMITCGIERASKFNWETTVAETLNILK